jgi:putative FmdB family regulatory protein
MGRGIGSNLFFNAIIMPIYEYEPSAAGRTCPRCANGLEIIQAVTDAPLTGCPDCGAPIKKVISWCRAAIVEIPETQSRVEDRIKAYEKAGMWSHAAELADKHAEKLQDKATRLRAVENYAKAGYDAATLDKHLGGKHSGSE